MARFYDKFVVRDVPPYVAVKNGVKELGDKVAQVRGIRSTPALEKAYAALGCCSEKLENISVSMERGETVSSSSYRP
jgi:hypothetical protein